MKEYNRLSQEVTHLIQCNQVCITWFTYTPEREMGCEEILEGQKNPSEEASTRGSTLQHYSVEEHPNAPLKNYLNECTHESILPLHG